MGDKDRRDLDRPDEQGRRPNNEAPSSDDNVETTMNQETPEPRDARSYSRMEILIMAVLAAIIVACGVFIYRYTRPKRGPEYNPPAGKAKDFLSLNHKEIGSSTAKVDILAVLPLSTTCHGLAVTYLQEVAEAFPDKVHVRFVDFLSEAGRKELRDRNCGACATILIDGKPTGEDAEGNVIEFTHGPEEDYSIEDLRAVLQHKLDLAYGDAAPKLRPTGRPRIAVTGKEAEPKAGESKTQRPKPARTEG